MPSKLCGSKIENMEEDYQKTMALSALDSIEKRIAEARLRDDYDSIRVDMLAIISYIQRQLSLIESTPPPDEH